MPTFKTLAIATTIAMMAMAGAAEARCPGEGAKRSKTGDRPTSITFRAVGENDETQFKIYWLDYQGRRKLYRHIFAGDVYRQPTYMTHPWLVTAPVPGGGEDCVGIYMPRSSGRTITLN